MSGGTGVFIWEGESLGLGVSHLQTHAGDNMLVTDCFCSASIWHHWNFIRGLKYAGAILMGSGKEEMVVLDSCGNGVVK